MEDNSNENNEELTSTNSDYPEMVGKDTKNEINDSIPTSSTDASSTPSSSTTTQLIVPDDPISSTSSDIGIDTMINTRSEPECSSSKPNELIATISTKSLTETLFVSAKDLLDMNISDVSTEKITENVDDIVQDLENLLGEPTTSLDFPIRINEIKESRPKVESNDCKINNSNNVEEIANICSASEEIAVQPQSETIVSDNNEEITSNLEKIDNNVENPANLEVDSSTNNNEVTSIENRQETVVNSEIIEKLDGHMGIDHSAGTRQEIPQDSNENRMEIVEQEINDNEVLSNTENLELIETKGEKSENIDQTVDNNKANETEENSYDNNIPESTVEDVGNTIEQIQEVTDSNQVVDMEIEESTSVVEEKNDDNIVDSTNSTEIPILTTIDESKINEKPVNSSEITESSTIVDNLQDNRNIEGTRQDTVDSSVPSTSTNRNVKFGEPLLINVDDCDKERQYSPKITIKLPKDEQNDEKDANKGSLKMTITKQSDTMHSILKIYNPADETINKIDEIMENQELIVPKLIIKPVLQPSENNAVTTIQRSSSPRITIKPIIKPENLIESISPLKITIVKNDQQKHSPKLTIKPIIKTDEIVEEPTKTHSPRITIKPIIRPDEIVEETTKTHSPRITIKPLIKRDGEDHEQGDNEINHSPKITIKPIIKPNDDEIQTPPRITIKPLVKPPDMEMTEKSLPVSSTTVTTTITTTPTIGGSPKITIKPIVKPQDCNDNQFEDVETDGDEIKERIVLKINKNSSTSSSSSLVTACSSPSSTKDDEKLTKITLKFSKEGGHPHIVQNVSQKRPIDNQQQIETTLNQQPQQQQQEMKRLKSNDYESAKLALITHSKLKEILNQSKNHNSSTKPVTIELDDDDDDGDDDENEDDDVKIVENTPIIPPQSPIVISEESNQETNPNNDNRILNIKQDVIQQQQLQQEQTILAPPPPPPQQQQQQQQEIVQQPDIQPIITPRKRGRPRKVPLQVREDFKDIKEEEIKPIVIESTRPKRSCRGQSVKATLGIKPRKPRGPGRGRGSKRGMGTRSLPAPISIKETKSKLLRDDQITTELDDGGFLKTTLTSGNLPQQTTISTSDRADIVMYEEETRMSADTGNIRSKQVATPISIMDIEESQSSVQSTATIESVKVRRGTRLEVHQEPEGSVISADQLAEYYWGGSGPYMLQEQVAQFLGIKSFKRKYPNIPRRVVDMQERDFIRESGLACEAMCDLGLTAVNTADILDIMYSDFQDKYEEYCKHQRDRQAKDLTNKQRALSLAASQEKTKLDITQQAVQSAANWNLNFNKMRRTQRKACMDLQTLTIHYPHGKVKPVNRPKVGFYPVALVPGQFTDYYKEFTPVELSRLPINTLQHINKFHEMECDSQTDGSGSESDSSSSDTDSSYSGSSDGENCTLCKPQSRRIAAV